MTTSAEYLPFTEFIQHPTRSTARLAGVRALRLCRRDAEDLLVMPAVRADREGEVVDLVARILAYMVKRGDGRALLQQVLPDLLPWIKFLPAADRDVFLQEFAEVAEAATSIDNIAPVAQLLVEWRHTAEVHADPELRACLSHPRGEDYGPAYPPGPEEGR